MTDSNTTFNSTAKFAVTETFNSALLFVLGVAMMLPVNSIAQTAGQLTIDDALDEFQLQEYSTPISEMIDGWVAPKKLVVVVDKPERTAWLQQAMPDGVRVVGVSSDAKTRDEIADADAVIQSHCSPQNFAGSQKLKWIHAGGAGSDQCLVIDGVSSGKVVLTNSQKVKNIGLAEMAIGHVFALARSIDVTVDNQRAQQLGAIRGRRGKQISGSTMLVVGLGGAGTEIARLAHGLGMNIIATRNSSREGPEFVSYVGLADELPELIGQADVVMIAAPLTPSTQGLFDAEMLARMKKDAMLVNWTRTEIVVMKDLEQALRNGTIGSAAINWASYESLQKGDSLWTTPNLLLTTWGGSGVPTVAMETDSTVNEMRWLVVRENMRRFSNGEKLYSVFNIARGY